MASAVVAQLPRDAHRVVVRGTSGSGKTTMAQRIAATLRIPHVELDAVFHQPGWTPLPDEAFAAQVTSVAEEDAWVVCGNYRRVSELLMARADTAVLYDLPRRIVMARVVRRTLRRLVRREVLWNGNRERVRNLCSLDPEESVIVWAWTTHAERHDRIVELLAHPPRDDLRLVHIVTRADERRVYAGLRAARDAPATAPGLATPCDGEGRWTSV